MTGRRSSSTPITTTFQYVNEPSVIRYTTDGSKPTHIVDAVGLDRAARAGRGRSTSARRHVQVDGDGHEGQRLDREAKFQIK